MSSKRILEEGSPAPLPRGQRPKCKQCGKVCEPYFSLTKFSGPLADWRYRLIGYGHWGRGNFHSAACAAKWAERSCPDGTL